MTIRMIRGRTQRWWFFVGLALLVHGVLVVAITYREVLERPEPVLSGKFVKRRPLQQPYLERRVERPAALPVLKRSVTASRPYARSAVQYALAPVHPPLLGTRLEVPALPPRPVSFARGLPSSGRLRSPPAEVSVQAADHLDLGLELLDVEHLDTGRYRALVVQDPSDRRNLEGYVHFSAVAIPSVRSLEGENWGPFRPEAVARSVDRELSNYLPDLRHSANIRALASLAAEVEEQTGLKAVLDEDLDLPSPQVLESPFILLTSARPFEPSAVEAEQLGRYLVSGGFAYVEQVGAPWLELWGGTFRDLLSLRDLIRMALATQGLGEGTDWSFEPLDLDHPLFHSYYDIGTLPTNYWQATYANVSGLNEGLATGDLEPWPTYEGIPPYLEGIHLKGRLVLVYSQQNYRDFWWRRPERHLTRASENLIWKANFAPLHRPSSDPAIRLGINVVVFALTQEGSLARRYVKRGKS